MFQLMRTLSRISSWETFCPTAKAIAFIPFDLLRSFCVSLASDNVALDSHLKKKTKVENTVSIQLSGNRKVLYYLRYIVVLIGFDVLFII